MSANDDGPAVGATDGAAKQADHNPTVRPFRAFPPARYLVRDADGGLVHSGDTPQVGHYGLVRLFESTSSFEVHAYVPAPPYPAVRRVSGDSDD